MSAEAAGQHWPCPFCGKNQASAHSRLGHVEAAHQPRGLLRVLHALDMAMLRHRPSANPATSGEQRGKRYCVTCTTDVDHQTLYAVYPCRELTAICSALGIEPPAP